VDDIVSAGWWGSSRANEPTLSEIRTAERDLPDVVRWAADCAERVMGHFERIRPSDPRPLRAIEAARGWADQRISPDEVRAASAGASAAAHAMIEEDLGDPALYAAMLAARAAAHVAGAVDQVIQARHAAVSAVDAIAALAKPEAALAARNAEREWQLSHLPARLREVPFLADGAGRL
jgi:hypothetical protein